MWLDFTAFNIGDMYGVDDSASDWLACTWSVSVSVFLPAYLDCETACGSDF